MQDGLVMLVRIQNFSIIVNQDFFEKRSCKQYRSKTDGNEMFHCRPLLHKIILIVLNFN